MPDAFQRFYMNPVELSALYHEVLQLRSVIAQAALTTRDPRFKKLGLEVGALMEQFSRELHVAAAKTAVEADKAIVQTLKARLVRPPTGNRPGLVDVIASTVTSNGAASLSMAEVEIADLAKLDSAVGTSGVPYWRTQEFGSTANIGRTIFGTFMGGGTSGMPSQLQFRQHSVFLPGPGGPGTIERPIPAKHFLRDGTKVAETLWLQATRAAVNNFVRQVKQLRMA